MSGESTRDTGAASAARIVGMDSATRDELVARLDGLVDTDPLALRNIAVGLAHKVVELSKHASYQASEHGVASELRDQIAETVHLNECGCSLPGTECQPSARITDAVLAKVQPELDALWDQIDRDQHSAMAQADRAERAEAALERVLDRHKSVAELRGDPTDPRCTCGLHYPCPTRRAAGQPPAKEETQDPDA